MISSTKKYKINSSKSSRFNYYRKDYHNPLFPRNKKNISGFSANLNWKIKLIIFILIIFSGTTFYWLFFSDYFEIKYINISGTKKISLQEINDLAWNQTQINFLLLLPQKNLISFNKNQLNQKILSVYNLKNLEIKKKLPGTINVKLTEKDNFAVWQEGSNLFFIDSEGAIIDTLLPNELASTTYPLIFNRGDARIKDRQVELGKEALYYINTLNNQFKIYAGKMDINRFVIDNEEGVVKINLKQGPELIFNTKTEIERQLTRLNALISETFHDDISKILYINLKYGDKIYYQ